MLNVGENTYVTLEEANKIVEESFPLGSKKDYWNGLTDEQKEYLLIESTEEMELLVVNGIKCNVNQKLQFPRRTNFNRFNEITRDVKDCQVVNALYMLLVELKIEEADGKVLTSLKAEQELKRYTVGGFKMGGYLW